ncbi:hypothetical protein CGRA01v4_03022 [Colletotrichum graminicola]|uniref:Uncharacterized protein n=1 Tax=Colletotrichum graminicola (strain M1.001 / M2 / FGSC 10212) TaxID=645133 RepID=E3Q9S5_COLGM|nr:uncharacterized protein GLRG_02757 [Colletotrichum graminicola M1.001]EFQ27613.1 hypothetical protein GLRG_02757 [Colletotrichum graminicola M1.001]WDK11742.1 hypothetical protein CGRA01v4_03022 [Colletotrichum graminicola]
MWHKEMAILSAAASAVLASVDLVAATGGIANVEHGTTLPVESRILDLPAKPKRSIGPHLESKTFPHDNPFNITEEEARKHGHKIIPVESDLWDELVESSGINRDHRKNASLSKRAKCGKNWDDDDDPPNPTDWCTPIRNTGTCMLGLWVNRLVPHTGPNRGWVFDNTCEWIGENVPAAYYDWQEICSKLKYVTLFFINPDRWPYMAYAGHYYSSWDAGWELYYPGGKEGTRHPPRYYYRRYFNCSAT